jgi:hypothetical protein
MSDPRAVLTTIAGQDHLDQDFGYYAPAVIGDYAWHDDNGDGVQDASEPGLGGVAVDLFLDLDSDGVAEPFGDDGVPLSTTLTASDGSFQFTGLQPGPYFVGFGLPFGYTFTLQNATSDDLDSDAGPLSGTTAVAWLGSGAANVDMDAGLISSLDYGDLPEVYNSTMLGENGARHSTGSLRLGPGVEPDADGQESPTAQGDALDDGVERAPDKWTNGAVVNIVLDLQGTTPGGLVDVGIWIDWNHNGMFEGSDFFNFPGLNAGSENTVQITVPDAGTYQSTSTVNARVRAFDPASLPGGSLDAGDYLGAAANGEVEDYQWSFGPTAITLTALTASSPIPDEWFAGLALALLAGLAASGWVWRWRLRR